MALTREGTIMAEPVKRGDKWTVRVELPPDPVTGERKRTRITARTKAEVKRLVTEAEHAVLRGSYVEPVRQTFGEYLTSWLNLEARNRVRATTLSSYEQLARLHILPAIGGISLQKLHQSHLQALYRDKLASTDDTKGLSARSVKLLHALIRQALQHAFEQGVVVRNVADQVKPPKAVRPEVQTWDGQQLRAFLKEAEQDTRYPAIWAIAAGTGMRRGELLGLRWQDVDLERAAIEIRQTLVKTVDHKLIFQEPKTKASRRTVILSPALVEVIRRQRIRQKEWKLAHGPAWVESGLVFTTHEGKPIHPANLYNRFLWLSGRADLPKIAFHALRHTHATDLLRRGIHPKIVSERLGHSSISITLDTYSHVLPDMQRAALEGLDDALFGA
jgi:integrase